MASIPISCSKSNNNPKEDPKKGNKNRVKPKEDDANTSSKSKSKTKTKTVEIVSSDNVSFRVDELSAMESCVMNNWIQYEFDGALAFKFTSEILSKVIEFCKKHAETRKTNEKHAHEKKLMDFNSQFLKQNQSHLINLLH
ncbi:SKP1-like protein 1B, partial [Tanacetum coccineum]